MTMPMIDEGGAEITQPVSARHAFENQIGVYENARWGRLVVAMITSFHDDGSVNFEANQQLAPWLVEQGAEGLAIPGTTGESPAFTHEGQAELIAAIRDAVEIPIIGGAGSNNTDQAVDLTERATNAGADAIMSVVPYYNRPSQHGILEHFRQIADHTDRPIIIYNIPKRTGVNAEPETVIKMYEKGYIHGLKDATGSTKQAERIAKELGPEFKIYSGDDSKNPEFFRKAGAVGAISVMGHWAAPEMVRMYDALEAGNDELADKLHELLEPSFTFEASGDHPNPGPTKVMLGEVVLKNIIDIGQPRSPMVAAPEVVERAIKEASVIYQELCEFRRRATNIEDPLTMLRVLEFTIRQMRQVIREEHKPPEDIF